jgi:hypothetical protein
MEDSTSFFMDWRACQILIAAPKKIIPNEINKILMLIWLRKLIGKISFFVAGARPCLLELLSLCEI